MKTKGKLHLQCGYEDKCKNHDCMNCGFRKQWYELKLSLAEAIVIEDFAMCDLDRMLDEKPGEIELMQKIMRKVMKKVFDNEGEN